MEIFFVDRPLDGFGAVEVVEPDPEATEGDRPATRSP